MSGPIEDLRAQRRQRARRDLAASHAACAASRYIGIVTANIGDLGKPAPRPVAPVEAALVELAGAVDEWEAARGAWPPGAHYTVRLGRLVVAGTAQPKGAPLIDDATLTVTVADDAKPDAAQVMHARGWTVGRRVVVGVVDWVPPLALSAYWRRMKLRRLVERLRDPLRLVDWGPTTTGHDSPGMAGRAPSDFARMAAQGFDASTGTFADGARLTRGPRSLP